MKIRHIEIKAFAGLKNYELSFQPGQNCIYGPNERGKSTVLNFIKAMFYGLGDRRKKDNLRDKMTPRDGSKMAGTIWFSNQGKNYELYRSFGETSGLDQVKLIDLANNRKVDLSDYEEPGKELFGLSKDVFMSTVFVDANGPEIESDTSLSNSLWDALLDYMVSGGDKLSLNTVESRLEDKLYDLKSKSQRKGQIPSLRENLDELRLEQARNKELFQSEYESLASLESLSEELDELKNEANNLETKLKLAKLAEAKATDKILSAKAERLESLNSEAKGLEAELSKFKPQDTNFQTAINNLRTKAQDLEERTKTLAQEKLKYQEQDKKDAKSSSNLVLIINIFLFILIVVLAFFKEKTALIIAAIAFIALLFYQFLHRNSNDLEEKVNELQEKEESLSKEKEEFKKQVKTSGLEDISSYEALYNRLKQLEEFKEDLAFIDQEIDRLNQSQIRFYSKEDHLALKEDIKQSEKELKTQNLDLSNLELDYQEKQALETKLNQIITTISSKTTAINSLKARLNYLLRSNQSGELASPAEQLRNYRRKIKVNKEKLDKLNFEYEATKIALETLEASELEFRERVLPDLSKRASKYMEVITRGRYQDIYVEDDLSIHLKDSKNLKVLAPNQFSSGTKDQVWLAYRLALTDYLSKDNAYPLLLDDIFANFDNKRTKASLKLLSAWSNQGERQIILFTCHKKMSKFAEKEGNWEVKTLEKN